MVLSSTIFLQGSRGCLSLKWFSQAVEVAAREGAIDVYHPHACKKLFHFLFPTPDTEVRKVLGSSRWWWVYIGFEWVLRVALASSISIIVVVVVIIIIIIVVVVITIAVSLSTSVISNNTAHHHTATTCQHRRFLLKS